VRLTWAAPISGDPVGEYLVEAGDSLGSAKFGTFAIDAAVRDFAANAAAGQYFVRIKGRNGSGVGPASRDVWFRVGTCDAPPGPPLEPRATATADGPDAMIATLTWQAAAIGCPSSTWSIEVGTVPGAADVARIDTATATTVFAGRAPAATYYVRVRGRNAAGLGQPSTEIVVPRP
jgi:hypothetical protein